jgi:2-dehydro-3-deoxygluconokinase
MNGVNFTFRGKGVIPSKTEYYRAHSAIRELRPGDVDWDEIMSQTRAFHCGGIYTLISPTSSQVAIEAYKKAEQYKVFRSFDLNYRSKVEPDRDKARAINREIVPHTDFLVGNQADFFDTLGYETRPIKEDDPFDIWLEAYSEMLRTVARDFSNLKIIGTQLRGALSADRINWGAVLYHVAEDKIHQAVTRENVEIADRTGGGDSFASGTIAAVLNGKSLEDAVQWGAAHGILVQETPGDFSMVKQADVEAEIKRALAGGGVSALR